jgi:hypothetical protein
METAIECFKPLLALDNGEFVVQRYENWRVNVALSEREIFISYADSPSEGPSPVFENNGEYLDVIGDPSTVDARFIASLLPHIIELDEIEHRLILRGRALPEFDDCIAVFRKTYGVSVVPWNSLLDSSVKHRYSRLMWDLSDRLITDESFMTSTLFCGDFDGVMVYRLIGNVLL